ncbi:MAG: 16S rRNA (cytosine(1402)-N(4))-methyltransferase RsmH [Rhodospirillaceae bacterium]|nr:16S rRNA (cytosine(1402)-N(4))-methyltransferase RsmH [Rhodospirillaceae bacterium]
MSGGTHISVLRAALLSAIAPVDGDVVVDATFGRGGHTAAFLAAAACRVVAVDRDPEAIAAAEAMAARFPGRLDVRHGRFGDLDRLVGTPADGVAFDLGVSSPQIDDPARGFSFRADGPLDMRMGSDGPSAADLVNTLGEADLAALIRELGEDRFARRIARMLVARRPFTRTAELADAVRAAVPPVHDGIHPATRTFQALRMAVNDELGELDRGLDAAERLLKPGGRLAVIAFHSLEDRTVKRFLIARSGGEASPSRHQPAVDPASRRKPSFRLVARRPVTPDAEELAANPRARSARLRAAIRTDAPAWSAEVAA